MTVDAEAMKRRAGELADALERLIELAEKGTPGPFAWHDGDLHPQANLKPNPYCQGSTVADGDAIIITDSGFYPPHGADKELIPASLEWVQQHGRQLLTILRAVAAGEVSEVSAMEIGLGVPVDGRHSYGASLLVIGAQGGEDG